MKIVLSIMLTLLASCKTIEKPPRVSSEMFCIKSACGVIGWSPLIDEWAIIGPEPGIHMLAVSMDMVPIVVSPKEFMSLVARASLEHGEEFTIYDFR